MMSLVIPVYRSAANVPPLLAALAELHRSLADLEVVFVVDGSPDDSYLQLAAALPRATFPAQLIALSRNFGTYAAVRAGLAAARGSRFAVMAADLQEPLELILEFDRVLRAGEHDLAVGQRMARTDPLGQRLLARAYWALYRRLVQPQVPEGGVDVFACGRIVRDQILRLGESNGYLVGLLFWVGFRRATVPYVRQPRIHGRSAWTFRKRLGYLADSVFGFSDLPIKLLFRAGLAGLFVSMAFGLVTVFAKLSGNIPIPGYAATLLTVIFFGALNCVGLGIIGGYVWRTFENSKGRPNFIVAAHDVYPPGPAAPAP
jgi:polyisoprenyl-phosphate glycosyltransferase